MNITDELNKRYNEPVSQILSFEESAIDRLIGNIESSSNPTLDLLHIMELANRLSYKISKKIDKGKNILGGKYTANDRIPKTNSVSAKVFNSKLNNDQKIFLLHLYGDKDPAMTLTKHYQTSQSNNLNNSIHSISKNNDQGLNL